MNNTATTFWKYLNENKIEIPIIQRDYAQGRIGKEELRKSFLGNLKTALDSENKQQLDFVYGSSQNGKINPLDGQQRLTTLWLLHWYIALKAGVLDANKETFKKFSYETRVSSREFIQRLCEYKNNPEIGKLVSDIQNQTWFYSEWKQDPTIQSMLRMLSGTTKKDKTGNDIVDGIEELFNETSPKHSFKEYWDLLIGDNCPIVFYSLNLGELKLTDDLYIKMNARGEQLTSFENFKADLVGYINIKEKAEADEQKEWKGLLDATNGVPIKMDTSWTDIFWKNKSKDNKIDEIYFAFLNRYFWNELFIAKNNDKYVLDIGKGDESSTQENQNLSYKYLNDSDNPNDRKIAYSNLDVYKYHEKEIPKSFFSSLIKVLDNYLKYKSIPECSWDKSFHFIPQYEKEGENEKLIKNNKGEDILSVTVLNQVQRIVFFAVCKYFKEEEEDAEANPDALNRWMRVVWNLISGEDASGRPQIRSTSAMRAAMEFIQELNSHDVYTSLKGNNLKINKNNPSDFEKRCLEEREKAKKILTDDKNELRQYDGSLEMYKNKTWESAIIDAEKYAFFKGAIRFLFRDGEGKWDWKNFDTKWTNAQKYFDENGVKDDESNKYKSDALLLRYLISNFTEWSSFWNMTYDSESNSWRILLLEDKWKNPIDKLMKSEQVSIDKNYKSCVSGGPNDQCLIVQSDLVTTNLLTNIEKGCHINWRDPNYVLYPSNAKADKKKYVIANKRNSILSSLYKENQIYTDQKIEDCNFFRGRNIDFEYKGNKFQWNTDGKIYLINNENNKGAIDTDNITKSEVLRDKLNEIV